MLLAAFAAWQGRAPHPLLPPSVVLDRNRGGADASMFLAGAGLFGTFLLLSYYLQQTRGYSPLVTGVAFLPFAVSSALASNLSTIVLMPRVGPKPVVASGMLAEVGATAWLAQLGAYRVRRKRARPDHPCRPRHGHGDLDVGQHRHLRVARRTPASPRPLSPSANSSAPRSAPRW